MSRFALSPAQTLPAGRQTARERVRLRRLDRLRLGLGLLATTALGLEPVGGWLRARVGRGPVVLLAAAIVAACAVPLTRRLALRIGAVDTPDRRKIHDRPTPRLGGLAVFGGIAAALVVGGVLDAPVPVLLAAAALLGIAGVLDDLVGVPAGARLVVQVVASLLVIRGGVVLTVLPHEGIAGDAANVLLTLVWLVGITNAFNFFDGMDGLAAGLAVILAGFLGAVALLSGQGLVGWLSAAIAGSCLGFLPYNFRLNRPAGVFLGDGGSTVLGFLLAALAVHAQWAVGHPLIDLAAPAMIFGVLIFDLVHTTVSRVARGEVRSLRQWLEYTGRDHLHHRFESLLRSKPKAVLMVLLLAVTLGLSALAMRSVGVPGSLLLLLQCGAILVVVTILEYAGNRRERRRP